MSSAHRSGGFSLQLAVADLEVTEAFYAGLLELPVERALTAPGAPEHLVMHHHGWRLIFVAADDLAAAHPLLGGRLEDYPAGVGATLHFVVKDLEGIAQAVADEGLEVLYPLQVLPYGMKELWLFDPDGYLLVLEEPLPRRS